MQGDETDDHAPIDADGGTSARDIVGELLEIAPTLREEAAKIIAAVRGEDVAKSYDGLTSKQYADLAALHAGRALLAADGDSHDRELAIAHSAAAIHSLLIVALTNPERNDIACCDKIRNALAMLDNSEADDHSIVLRDAQNTIELLDGVYDELRGRVRVGRERRASSINDNAESTQNSVVGSVQDEDNTNSSGLLGDYLAKGFEELTARQHADLAALYAERSLTALDGGNRDRLQAQAHIMAAGMSLASQKGDDILCRGIIHNTLALIGGNMEVHDATENLELALNNAQKALALFNRAHDEGRAAFARANLGNAYLERRTGADVANVEQGIHHLEKALANIQVGTPQWIDIKSNLADAYQRRKIGSATKNLASAVQCIRDALAHVDPADDPERWADLENNLGMAISIGAQNDNDLREAITHFEAALNVTERDRFPRQWADLHNNISRTLADLTDGDVAAQRNSAIEHLRLMLEVYTPYGFPDGHLATQRALGHKLLKANRFEEAHVAFSAGIEVARTLFADAFTWQGRQQELASAAALFFRDAYCLARLRKFNEALSRLEEGRARVLNEAISILEMHDLTDDDVARIAEARERVRHLDAQHLALASRAPGADRSGIALKLQAARDTLVEIVEGLRPARFQHQSRSAQELLAMIPLGNFVIAPVVTEAGTTIFVVPGGTTELGEEHVLRLDEFTINDLHGLLTHEDGWLSAYREREENPDHWRGTIEAICRRLWAALMNFAHARALCLGLEPGDHIVLLCPGLLGVLPVHAAMRTVNDQERYLCDEFSVSYAPSIAALGNSLRRARTIPRIPASLLAVLGTTKDLPFASAEMQLVLSQFDPRSCRSLSGAKATAKQIFKNTDGAQYLHFACHGNYDPSNVLSSSLQFSKGELTLQDIISYLPLTSARLVVLSACETGVFEIRGAPDEQLGLRSGFLLAGAAGVIGTLWPVNDVATMLLVDYFYRMYLGPEAISPADALCAAQKWLRTATNDDLADQMRRLRSATNAKAAKILDAQFERFAFARDRKEAPFNHPYYWAAFVMDGA